MNEAYEPDRSLRGKLRRRLVGLHARRPARASPPRRGMVSFTFDDIPLSAAEAGAEVLARAGVRGVFYVASGLYGRESHLGRFAEAEEVRRLAAASHEIGCHTHSHADLAHLPAAAFERELDVNGLELERVGATPKTFAYPYGEVGFAAKGVVARRFALGRTVQAGLVRRGTDLAQAPAVGVEGPGGEASALRWLARAAAEGAWAIIYTHDVRPNPSAWGCTPGALARVVDYALRAGLQPVTATEGATAMEASR